MAKGKGGFVGRQALKNRAPLCNSGMGRDEIKSYEKHEEYKSKRTRLLEPGALQPESNNFSLTENPVINPGYQGKGCAGNAGYQMANELFLYTSQPILTL